MAAAQEVSLTIDVGPDKLEQLLAVGAQEQVLQLEAQGLRDAVDLLSPLSSEPTDAVLLPASAEAATSEDVPASSASEVLPLLQRAFSPYTARQSDPSDPQTLRWTQDWGATKRALTARIGEEGPVAEGLREQMVRWFLDRGSSMVESHYAGGDKSRPLYVEVGGANDQCSFRAVQVLASLADDEFRQTNGLATRPVELPAENPAGLQDGEPATEWSTVSLTGEDGREVGWMKDQEFVDRLRAHVAGRVQRGEVAPQIIVGGSSAKGRVLKEKELAVVSKYLAEGAEPLYPDLGWTEADAMLAGALRTYGRAEGSELTIVDRPGEQPDDVATKIISFESEVGPVTFIASPYTYSPGSEPALLHQLLEVQDYDPSIFEGVDGLYGATTAIYTWSQQPALEEAAARIGLHDIDITTLGLSAHAAGIPRKTETLVAELVNYLQSLYDVAVRATSGSERNAVGDIEQLGGLGRLAIARMLLRQAGQTAES